MEGEKITFCMSHANAWYRSEENSPICSALLQDAVKYRIYNSEPFSAVLLISVQCSV